jgi:hypothetical protein
MQRGAAWMHRLSPLRPSPIDAPRIRNDPDTSTDLHEGASMSEAKSARRRRGQADKVVDPDLSAKRRLAAQARWRRTQGDPAQPMPDTPAVSLHRERARAMDNAMVDHLHRRLDDGRTTAYEVLAGTQAEMVGIILGIARDVRETGKTRLRAAELALQMATAATETTRPSPATMDIDPRELDAMIADLRILRDRKQALEADV